MKNIILILAFGFIAHSASANNTYTLPGDSVKKTGKKITKAKKEAKIKTNPEVDKVVEPNTQATTKPHPNALPIAPTYKEGQQAMLDFIKANLKMPEEAKKAGVTITVNVSFVVGVDGKLKNIKSIKTVGMGCDEEAERIVKLMPNWNPAKVGRTSTEMSFAIGIEFKN